MKCNSYKFSSHSIQRMFERDIKKDAVISAISDGEIIQKYLDDVPYPSYLILQNTKGHPIHVVLAFDESKKIMLYCYCISPRHSNLE